MEVLQAHLAQGEPAAYLHRLPTEAEPSGAPPIGGNHREHADGGHVEGPQGRGGKDHRQAVCAQGESMERGRKREEREREGRREGGREGERERDRDREGGKERGRGGGRLTTVVNDMACHMANIQHLQLRSIKVCSGDQLISCELKACEPAYMAVIYSRNSVCCLCMCV